MDMQSEPVERRKEARYPIEAEANVHTSNGQSIPANATNISSFGMLLHIEQPTELSLNDEVTVEIKLPDDPGKPFSSWGVARVARIDGSYFGIQLYGGTFDSPD
jgi:hypothetical protein